MYERPPSGTADSPSVGIGLGVPLATRKAVPFGTLLASLHTPLRAPLVHLSQSFNINLDNFAIIIIIITVSKLSGRLSQTTI